LQSLAFFLCPPRAQPSRSALGIEHLSHSQRGEEALASIQHHFFVHFELSWLTASSCVRDSARNALCGDGQASRPSYQLFSLHMLNYDANRRLLANLVFYTVLFRAGLIAEYACCASSTRKPCAASRRCNFTRLNWLRRQTPDHHSTVKTSIVSVFSTQIVTLTLNVRRECA